MDCMLDMESLGVGSAPVVLSIGAVAFDPAGKMPSNEELYEQGLVFHSLLNLSDQQEKGLKITPSTVLWWMEQSDAARTQFASRDREMVPHALLKFSNWCKERELKHLWSYGAAADAVWLESLYRAYGMFETHYPFSYREVRCFRTLVAMSGKPAPAVTGTKHNALDDAIYQARWLQQILNQ